MIKFFRKIRQKLLSEGKTGTYFKYALGEILLVMIGILLALQVNNWNQDRKNKRLKTSYIKNLKEDLQKDSEYLVELDSINTAAEKSGNYLANFLDNKTTQIDSIELAKSIVFTSFIPNPTIITSTYNDLINSNNINLFNDAKLKRLLDTYYILNNWSELLNGRILKTAWYDYRDEMLKYHNPLLYKDFYALDYTSLNNVKTYKIQWDAMKTNEHLKTQVGMIGAYRIIIRNNLGGYISFNKTIIDYLENLE